MQQFSNEASDYAVVYHWWSFSEEKKVVRNLQFPIIQSIATMRYYNPNVACYVFDYSDDDYEWDDYPKRFNFVLIKNKCFLETFVSKRKICTIPEQGIYIGKGPSVTAHQQLFDYLDIKLSSWILDIWELSKLIPERFIISSESDVFWINRFLYLKGDAEKIHLRSDSLGVFYFDKNSSKVADFIELWRAYISLSINDFNFRRKIIDLDTSFIITTKHPLLYIENKHKLIFKESVEYLNQEEFIALKDFSSCVILEENLRNLKWIHAGKTNLGIKGQFSLYCKEIYNIMKKCFTLDEIFRTFGSSTFNNSIFSLEDICGGKKNKVLSEIEEKMNAKVFEV